MADNGQIARTAFEDLYTKRKLDIVDQHYDASYKGHETMAPNMDRDQFRKNAQMYLAAFPDLVCKVDEVAAAGDKVLLRWTARGTHKGPLFGASPSGKPFNIQGITVYTFRNSKIAEEWTQWDALGMIRQLGIAQQVQGLQAQASP